MKRFASTTLILLFACACPLVACSQNKPNADSRSNWLRSCSSASDCADGLSCACGVCTRSCEDNEGCAFEAVAAECTSVTATTIAAACGARQASAGEGHVCLQACFGNDDCGDTQRCVIGACVGREPDRDAQVGDAQTDGAPSVPIGDGAVDPSDDDGGGPSACFESQRECCPPDGCPDPQICHVDGTCIASGQLDERGRATLQARMPYETRPLLADSSYVYGVYGEWHAIRSLVRWPVAGGDAEVLATGLAFGDPPGLVADDTQLYFTAAATPDDLSFTLWRMPKDGSTEPEPSGTAGNYLVQDATDLYFTNDGDSRVLRIAKSAFGAASAREEVLVSASDAALTIVSLATNSTTLFVSEVPPHPAGQPPLSFTLRTYDLQSKSVAKLTDSSRFSDLVSPALLASDTHLALFGAPNLVRLDLSTLEIKPLPGPYPDAGGNGIALQGDHLFVPSNDGVDDITLSTAHRRALALGGSLFHPAASASDLFGVLFVPDGNKVHQTTLLRIVR